MMENWLLWLMLAALSGSTLFSTLAYAYRMMSRVTLEARLETAGRPKALDEILSARHDLALSSSIMRVMFNVALAILVCYDLEIHFAGHPLLLFGAAVVISGAALLICSVAVPQAWARYAGETLIARSWPLLRVSYAILYPLIAPMHLVDEVVRRLSGVSLAEDAQQEAEQTEQEILAVVSEGRAEGTVDEDQKKMIEGVISFRDLSVGQIMTPRTELVAADIRSTLVEVREKIMRDGLSRLPVFDGTLDNIVGVLYAKDLLALVGNTDGQGDAALRKFMRPPLFVPQSKPLRDLLKQFRGQRVHMAIVLDEYGGTAGLVTTEDILEEIVGDIVDEYERPVNAELKRIDHKTFEVDARMNITDINRELGLQLPENQDYQSAGGFVIDTLGIIPARGEKARHENVLITVLDSDSRRVKRLRIDILEESAADQNAQGVEVADAG